jgi:C_GCAxxG_C_C family probable redox protein
VLASFAPEFGLDRDTALKAACGIGAGFARLGETCGAVAGAMMVIGLRYGHARPEDAAKKEETYEVVRQFIARFVERHGTIVCRELIGCEITTAAGLAGAQEKGIFRNICTGYLRDAVELLETMV